MATSKTLTKPARKAARDRSGALYLLLDPRVLASLDEWTEALNVGNNGPQWTRTAVVRALIARGLTERKAKGETP